NTRTAFTSAASEYQHSEFGAETVQTEKTVSNGVTRYTVTGRDNLGNTMFLIDFEPPTSDKSNDAGHVYALRGGNIDLTMDQAQRLMDDHAQNVKTSGADSLTTSDPAITSGLRPEWNLAKCIAETAAIIAEIAVVAALALAVTAAAESYWAAVAAAH